MLEEEPSSEAVAVHTLLIGHGLMDFSLCLDQRQNWEGNVILSLIHLGSFSLMRTSWNSWKLSSTHVLIETIVCLPCLKANSHCV